MVAEREVRSLRRGVGVLRRNPEALQHRGSARAVWPQTILVVKGPLVTFGGKIDRAGKGQDFIIADHPAFTGIGRKIRVQLVQVGALSIMNFEGIEITPQVTPLL